MWKEGGKEGKMEGERKWEGLNKGTPGISNRRTKTNNSLR